MRTFIKTYPLTSYFVLAYSIAWVSIFFINRLTVPGPAEGDGVLKEGIVGPMMMMMWIAMLLGAGIAGLLIARIVDGREGFRKLLSGMIMWKTGIQWYIASILIFPAVIVPILYGLRATSPDYAPGMMVSAGILAGFVGGFIEEIGWTGFALRKLQARHTPFFAILILGVMHAMWHLYPDYLGSVLFYKSYYILHFFLWVIALIAFRFIAAWVYNRSGSLLLAQLAHGSFTASQLVFGPPAASAYESVLWYGIFAAALSVIAAVIIVADEKIFFERSGADQRADTPSGRLTHHKPGLYG